MKKENGGSVAQRGFNYQNSVISLVAIRNYKKKNFCIFVETEDDFEVTFDDSYHAYIQVKGQKNLSFKKLIKNTKDKESIFEKNIFLGNDSDVHKIVVYSITDISDGFIEDIAKEELFHNSWRLSTNKKNEIIEKFGEAVGDRLNNFAVVLTDFKNEFRSARVYLTGELVQQKISVESRDELILDELLTLIIQKSEKDVTNVTDRELKKITSNDLELIFQKVNSKQRFNEELERFEFTSFKKEKIKKEELYIPITYMSEKKEIVKFLKENESRLEDESLEDLIPSIFKINKLKNLDENCKYAISISAYCEILEGVYDD